MLTLKEWYDRLPNISQRWVMDNCSEWFDITQPDYYKVVEPRIELKDSIPDILNESFPDEKVRNCGLGTAGYILEHYLQLLSKLNKEHPEVISDALYDASLRKLLDSDCIRTSRVWIWGRTLEERKYLYYLTELKDCYYDKTLRLHDYLFTVNDYSKLDMSQVSKSVIEPGVIDIIGYDVAKEWAIDDYTRLTSTLRNCVPNELFDDLFFGETDEDGLKGWSTSTKNKVIARIYEGMSTLEEFNDFLYRMVAVDHSYLRYLDTYLKKYPALGTEIYKAKKPEHELTGNESVADRFRYSPEIRKLGKIVNACIRKSISKANCGSLREVGPLVKLYGYNYRDVYLALYPNEQ